MKAEKFKSSGNWSGDPAEWRSCLEKVTYKTEELAAATASELANLEHPRKKIRHLAPYQCRYCPYWHLRTQRKNAS